METTQEYRPVSSKSKYDEIRDTDVNAQDYDEYRRMVDREQEWYEYATKGEY